MISTLSPRTPKVRQTLCRQGGSIRLRSTKAWNRCAPGNWLQVLRELKKESRNERRRIVDFRSKPGREASTRRGSVGRPRGHAVSCAGPRLAETRTGAQKSESSETPSLGTIPGRCKAKGARPLWALNWLLRQKPPSILAKRIWYESHRVGLNGDCASPERAGRAAIERSDYRARRVWRLSNLLWPR
jgi:hypothetical protein